MLFDKSKANCIYKGGMAPSAVPQGIVLGPLLFLLQMNGLPNNLRVKSFLYANDSTLINVHTGFDELQVLVKRLLEDASRWFRSNRFLLSEA